MITNAGTLKYGMFASAPVGHLLCDGSSVTATQYPNLAAAWGKSGTFSLPDFRGAGPVGTGSGYSLGAEGGASSVVLTESQMPQHDHTFTGSSHSHSFTGSSHSHGFSGDSHSHSMSHGHSGTTIGGQSGANTVTGTQGTTGWKSFSSTSSVGSFSGSTGGASTGGSVQSASTGGSVGSTSTGGTVGNAGSGSSFSILNPYVVCLAVIKF